MGDHILERLGVPSTVSGETNGFARSDTQTLQPHATGLWGVEP